MTRNAGDSIAAHLHHHSDFAGYQHTWIRMGDEQGNGVGNSSSAIKAACATENVVKT